MTTSNGEPSSGTAGSGREPIRTPATTPTPSKARKRPASSGSASSAPRRPRTATARKSGSGTTRKSGSRPARERTPTTHPEKESGTDRKATIAKAAAGAVAGTAALGVAAWAALKRQKRPRVLGVPMPRVNLNGMKPSKPDVSTLAKKIGDIAQRVEHTSEGVRDASAQAQKVTRKLS